MSEIKMNYKDGMFKRLFNDEEEIRKLYNALSGSSYPQGVNVEIVTLDSSIMGDLKNDLAFIIDDKLIILIEHQSTINPNMPLRMLCYLAKEYEKLYFTKSIYSKQRVPIPTPEFYVFYNGKEPLPDKELLKLSDSYMQKCAKISLELNVEV
ncbi:MAG: Rpn family recombination-promoting nuclease/putative transposase, partial [Firmicutes bacterium]|nr:Rpn family recombination-promoting nuclease/putative transposase [Bacillota bacterium]